MAAHVAILRFPHRLERGRDRSLAGPSPGVTAREAELAQRLDDGVAFRRARGVGVFEAEHGALDGAARSGVERVAVDAGVAARHDAVELAGGAPSSRRAQA